MQATLEALAALDLFISFDQNNLGFQMFVANRASQKSSDHNQDFSVD